MKKATKIVLGVVGGIIVISAIASNTNKSNAPTTPNSNNSTSQQAQSAPAQSVEKMIIKNSTYQEADGLKEVIGEITNNDTKKHSATLKATFYDAGNKIIGTAVGAVNEVAPNETKTFNLLTNDSVEGYKELKVQVDTLL